jgi:cob(I)alamin adenosyltransferase
MGCAGEAACEDGAPRSRRDGVKIYTKQGDRGQSVLFDGTRVPKDHLRLETYGTIDELNSHLGLARAHIQDTPLAELLLTLQLQLFELGSDLATPLGAPNEAKVARVGPERITFLERQIDEATSQLPALKRFILPGGSVAAAELHVARTICRRAERLLVTLMHEVPVGDHLLIYLNRFSDLLFVLARVANQRGGLADVEWSPA